MRGVAALLAALAAWVLVAGDPIRVHRRLRRPAGLTLGTATGGAAAGLITGGLALGVTSVPAVAGAIAILVAFAPSAVVAARTRKSRELLAEAWPDFLAVLRTQLAAGAALPDAFLAATRRTDVLEPRAADLEREVIFGAGFGPALRALRSQLADPTADRVLITIAAAHHSGGTRVGQVMSALASSIADELRLRKAHHAALTEQRLTALVALLAPWALLGLTVSTNPQSATAFRTPSGAAVIAIGLVATGAGYVLARRTARLAAAPRVFR